MIDIAQPRKLELKVKTVFEKKGYLVDRSLFNFKKMSDGTYRANKNDFAHVFDLICYKQDYPVLLLQVCMDSVVKQHQKKIDRLFGMHSCNTFKVIIVGVVKREVGKSVRYEYKYYERLQEGWVRNPYI